MPTGTVKKWFGDRGFGFITPEDGSADVFVHMKCLFGCNDYLTEGEVVECEAKRKATEDRIVSFVALSCAAFRSHHDCGRYLRS